MESNIFFICQPALANLDMLKQHGRGRMLVICFAQLFYFPFHQWVLKTSKRYHTSTPTPKVLGFWKPFNFLICMYFFSLCMCGMMTTSASPNKRLSVSDHADVLACHICLEVYDERGHEAKFLSCHHSFCSACLTHLAAKTHDYIECPSCRAHTSLTEAGISGEYTVKKSKNLSDWKSSLLQRTLNTNPFYHAGLQTNFYITYMRETFNTIGSPKMKGCVKHAHQPMSFFCQKCGYAICRDCTVLDHKESDGHSIQVTFMTICVKTKVDFPNRFQRNKLCFN